MNVLYTLVRVAKHDALNILVLIMRISKHLSTIKKDINSKELTFFNFIMFKGRHSYNLTCL
jgi:hypothetical protein